MKITQERLEEFWGRCGFQFWKPVEGGAYDTKYPTSELVLSRDLPELTLDNLFKYAVPLLGDSVEIELFYPSTNWYCQIKKNTTIVAHSNSYCSEPELALFDTLEKALEVKE